MWARAASLILPCALLPAIHTLAGERPDFAEGAAVLRAAVADGAFPGGVVCVGTSREVLWCQGFGRLALGESSDPADPSSLYDLASLTKVVGTTTVVLCLVRDGRMTLDEPLAKRLPGFLEAASNAEDRPG